MQNSIPKYKTHVCFVSEQTIPNFLPALIPSNKPEKVYLLSSEEMKIQKKDKALKAMFKNIQVDTEILQIPSASFSDIKEYLQNFLNTILTKGEITDIAFNLTGGTKLMSLAAYNACQELGIPMFYIDTFNEKLTILDKEEEYELANVLTVLNILNSYGYTQFKKEKPEQNNSVIINYLLNLKYPNLIKSLNACASKARQTLSTNMEMNKNFKSLLEKCEEAKLLTICENSIIFASEESRRFCNGEWLEDHILHVLQQLKKEEQISDYEGSMNVVSSNKNISQNTDAMPDNEFDALFVRKNILHLIECKTAKMDADDKTMNTIYKLDSLHTRIGGTFAKGILISYLPLSDPEKERAKGSGLIVIDEQKKIINLRRTFVELFKTRY